MKTISKRITIISLLFVLSLFCMPAVSAPYFNKTHEFTQPDGSVIKVVLNGDEFYMQAETLDGFTVIRDPETDWICYAELSDDGSELVSTGIPIETQSEITGNSVTGEKVIATNKTIAKKLEIDIRSKLNKVRHNQAVLFGEDTKLVNGLIVEKEDSDSTVYGTQSIDTYMPAEPATGNLPPTKDTSSFATTITGLVLIFDFSDAPAPFTLDQYKDKVKKPGFYQNNGNAASLRTYYEDVSRNVFVLDHVVYGIYRAPQTFAYYDSLGYGEGAHILMDIALNDMNNNGFDFSTLTTFNGGEISALCVMYTGNPKAWSEGMWFHAGGWGGFSADGVRTGRYCTDTANDLNPGTIIHEHGHMAAGWPDTYSYVATSEQGGQSAPGTWGVMGGGYSDLPNPYFLYQNGWMDGENVMDAPGIKTMNSTDAHFAYFYYDPMQPKEFFIMKPYTRNLLFCPGIPDEGMTFWRINTDGDNAQYPNRDRYVELIHASNDDNNRSSNVCFKDGGILNEYTSGTLPSTDWEYGSYSGQPSGLEVTEISGASSEMSFVVGTIPESVPYYSLNRSFNDASGNGMNAVGYNFSSSTQWSDDVFEGSYFDFDNALRFDGNNDYVVCPASVSATDELSVLFWVKPEVMADMVVLDKFPSDASGEGWKVELKADGKVEFYVGSELNHFSLTTEDAVYQAGEWVSVVCTFENNGAAIFINGSLRVTKQNITTVTNNNSINLRFGIPSEVEITKIYQGLLDDVRFYDQALDENKFRSIGGLNFRPEKSAMALLNLNETSGTVVSDASGHGNNGILNGELSFDNDSIDGKIDGAIEFDGVDDFIKLPSGMSKRNGGFTVTLWAKPTAVKGWARFIDFGNGSGADNIIFSRYQSTNDLIFQCYDGNTTSNVIASNALSLNYWQFFAAVVETSGRVTIYKNGIAKQTGYTSAPPEVYRKNIYIGKSNWPDEYYEGGMDDIRIYNYALPLAEIRDIYNNNRLDAPKPTNGEKYVSSDVTLTFTPADSALRHDIYFGKSSIAIENATTDSDEYMGRKRKAEFNPQGILPRREYFWRVDEVLADSTINKGPVWKFSTTGGIKLERWMGIDGEAVSLLTGSANYPNNPSNVSYINTFQIPSDYAEDYGSRLQGLLVPPETGSYTFWISGDNEVELWISNNANPANATRRAYIHNAYSNSLSFDEYSTQQSSTITMQAGQEYYIMALHKEDWGGDHMAVAWQGPGISTRQVINGSYIQTLPSDKEWPVIEETVQPVMTAIEDHEFSGSISGIATDTDSSVLNYAKATGPSWLKISATGVLSGRPSNDDAGINTFTVQVNDEAGGYAETILPIEVIDIYSGKMGVGDMIGFAQEWLSETPLNSGDIDQSGRVNFDDYAILAEQWQSGIMDGLVASWPLNDAMGPIARDSYGVHDGILTNMSEYAWIPGDSDNGLFFDGSDYVNIPSLTGVAGNNSRSCVAWIKTSQTANGDIIGWGNPSTNQNFSVCVRNNVLNIRVGSGLISGSTIINDNQWHHVAATWETGGDNTLSNAKLYVDGIEENIGALYNIAVNTSVDSSVQLGATKSAYRYQGSMHSVRLYERVISLDEIIEIAMYKPVFHMPFDDGTGNTATDIIGGMDGSLKNMYENDWIVGIDNNALNLDGNNDYIDLPNGFNDYSNGITVSIWAYPTAASSWARFMDFGNGAGFDNILMSREGNTSNLIFEAHGNGASGGRVTAVNAIELNKWQMFTATVDKDGNAALYKNGQLLQTGNVNISDVIRTQNYIGRSNWGADSYYKGRIDDFRIYDKALNESEVMTLFSQF